jgi:hypothetical protein
MFVHHCIRMSCPRSPTTMVCSLATSWGLYGCYFYCWVMVSHCSSLKPQGCCRWSCMRGLRPIMSTIFARWSSLPHRGGRSREEFEMPHKKLWPCCIMRKMTKWSTPNIDTFWAESAKELMLWCCPLKVMTTYDALLTKWSWPMLWLEILMRSWRKSNSLETMEM